MFSRKSNMLKRATYFIPLVLLFGCGGGGDSGGSQDDGGGPPATGSPPTISGDADSLVLVGDRYSFVPAANDPDGDALSFTVQNLPSWASFDSATGALDGRPDAGNVGIFDNIVITVSDGTSTTSLLAFSIEVAQLAVGAMSLSWEVPIENTDGSSLDNLSGFRIYYGLAAGDYPNMIEITTPGLTSYVIEDLSPGTYYVVATALNADGTESANSNMVIKIVG